MVRRFDVYCNGGWDGCTTYEEDCDCGDYVSAVDYAELVEAVRWERECDAAGEYVIRMQRARKSAGVALNSLVSAKTHCTAARAAVDALVGGEE